MAAGGIISIIIMVAGTGAEREDDDDDFGIVDLLNLFKDQIGQSSAVVFRVGLFCAAFSSCIAHPLAHPFVMQGLLGSLTSREHASDVGGGPWETGKGKFYRGCLLVNVLGGVIAASIEFDSVGMMILIQALSAILLPIVVTALLICVNDDTLMQDRPQTVANNALLFPSVWFSYCVSINGIVKLAMGDGMKVESEQLIVSISVGTAVLLAVVASNALFAKVLFLIVPCIFDVL
jgi:Mn2+/Fe2+ NRAMP family transporter